MRASEMKRLAAEEVTTHEATDAVVDSTASVYDEAPAPEGEMGNFFTIPDILAQRHEEQMAALQAQLDQTLDRALVKQRKGYGRDEKTGQTKMLDYLEWHTVVRQLNRLIGPGNWSWEVKDIQTFGADPQSGVPCAVSAVATLAITWPNGQVTSYTNNGVEVVKAKEIWENRRPTGKYEPRTWEAFEMAFKGAAHDALKRAATALGEQFGLSLYLKEEEAKAERVSEPSEGSVATQTAATSAVNPTTAPAFRAQPQAQVDEDDLNDMYAECQDCGKVIKGYVSRQGKAYKTSDLVALSKRNAGGQVLCYDCRQKQRAS